MGVPTLDIFRGSLKNGALWIESVDGLEAATQRMYQFSAYKPGPYFVFECKERKVLASIDTSLTRKPTTGTSRKKLATDKVA